MDIVHTNRDLSEDKSINTTSVKFVLIDLNVPSFSSKEYSSIIMNFLYDPQILLNCSKLSLMLQDNIELYKCLHDKIPLIIEKTLFYENNIWLKHNHYRNWGLFIKMTLYFNKTNLAKYIIDNILLCNNDYYSKLHEIIFDNDLYFKSSVIKNYLEIVPDDIYYNIINDLNDIIYKNVNSISDKLLYNYITCLLNVFIFFKVNKIIKIIEETIYTHRSKLTYCQYSKLVKRINKLVI